MASGRNVALFLVAIGIFVAGYVFVDVRMLRNHGRRDGLGAYDLRNGEFRGPRNRYHEFQQSNEHQRPRSSPKNGNSPVAPPCNFEATINTQRVLTHLTNKWSTPANGLNNRSGTSVLQPEEWHSSFATDLRRRFQSQCFNRRDKETGRAVTINFGVLMPGTYGGAPVDPQKAESQARNTDSGKRFPVLYLLHARDGAFVSSASTDVRPNVADVLVDYAVAMHLGLLPPMLVVLPFSKPCSLWTDFKAAALELKNPLQAQSETNLLAVVENVDRRFRTIPHASGRIVVGDSMGGEAAIRLLLKYASPAVFGAAVATDPGLFSWDSLRERGTSNYERKGFDAAMADQDDAAACKYEQRYYLVNVFDNSKEMFEEFSYEHYLVNDHAHSHLSTVRVRYVAGQDDKRHIKAINALESNLCRAGVDHSAVWVPGCKHDQGCILTDEVVRGNFAFVSEFLANRNLTKAAKCTKHARS